MANHLKMAEIQAIRVLHERGWSCRRIARELDIHRETVGRYIRRLQGGEEAGGGGAGENRPNPPTGSGGENQPNLPAGSDDQNRPNPPTGSSGPTSRCEPFREVILAALEQGLSAQRIWQDLRVEHGFADGYDCVKRFVRRLGG